MLVATILADMTVIMNLRETTDSVTTEVTDCFKTTEATDNVKTESTEIIDESTMIDETSEMMIDIKITEILDEKTGMITLLKGEGSIGAG